MLGITSKGELVEIDLNKSQTRHEYVAFIVFKGDDAVTIPMGYKMWSLTGIRHPQLGEYLQKGLRKSLQDFRHEILKESQPVQPYKAVLRRYLCWVKKAIAQL